MHWILLPGYFREELQQRILGVGGSVLGRPHWVLLGNREDFIAGKFKC